MFLWLFGRVYLKIFPNDEKGVCIQSPYLEFQAGHFPPPKIWIEAGSQKHIDLLLCYFGPLEFPIVMWLFKGSCQNYPNASLK